MSQSREDSAQALELMGRLHEVLRDATLEVAFEAVGNVMVLLAVADSNSREEAHEVIDEEWPALHVCLDANYVEVCRMKADAERRGATLH